MNGMLEGQKGRRSNLYGHDEMMVYPNLDEVVMSDGFSQDVPGFTLIAKAKLGVS